MYRSLSIGIDKDIYAVYCQNMVNFWSLADGPRIYVGTQARGHSCSRNGMAVKAVAYETKGLKPIRTEKDYEQALAEVEELWGAKIGTPKGDRLDVLATLIEAYEAEHCPMDPPEATPQ